MAFIVECPFCKLKAKVPGRASGAIGHCPNCANSFTLAPLDDQVLPESPSNSDAEQTAAPNIAAAIAVAAAVAEVNDDVAARQAVAEEAQRSPGGFQPASFLGALALLLAGFALIGGSVSFLRGLVLPFCFLGLLAGIAALIAAFQSARRRLLLPLIGTTSATAMLVVAWFFPALLGPAYEYAMRRRDPVPVGLHAIPLLGVPTLAEVPEWTDAAQYALQRDGLQVQVVRVSHLSATPAEVKDRLLVRVRVSLARSDAKWPERKETPGPTLADDAGKPYPLLKSEYFDRGGGKTKPGLFPTPTIEATFVFDVPAEGKSLRLQIPAEKWGGTGVFQFAVPPNKFGGP